MNNNNNNDNNNYIKFIKNYNDDYIFTFSLDSFYLPEFHEIMKNYRHTLTNGLSRFIIIYDSNKINIGHIEFNLPDFGKDEQHYD
jgi:DNA polymerase elongation subunit (family B)